MNDAENLSKLLGHLPPAVFRSFMAAKFSLEMPDLDKKAAKKDQRAGMEAVLTGKPPIRFFACELHSNSPPIHVRPSPITVSGDEVTRKDQATDLAR